jgi:hypothetical protein
VLLSRVFDVCNRVAVVYEYSLAFMGPYRCVQGLGCRLQPQICEGEPSVQHVFVNTLWQCVRVQPGFHWAIQVCCVECFMACIDWTDWSRLSSTVCVVLFAAY